MEEKNTTTLAKDKKEFVSSIITNKEGNVLVLKRREDLKLDPGKYDFCSGHMKEGEVPMQSMYRELNEELGLKPEQIKLMENLGDIETPHEKLLGTITHLYHIQIELSSEDINNTIKAMKEPEMEKVRYVKDIAFLKRLQTETESFRGKYTQQMGLVLDALEEKINQRKEVEKDLCEEK